MGYPKFRFVNAASLPAHHHIVPPPPRWLATGGILVASIAQYPLPMPSGGPVRCTCDAGTRTTHEG